MIKKSKLINYANQGLKLQSVSNIQPLVELGFISVVTPPILSGLFTLKPFWLFYH
jgi:hypothetical protein